MGQMQGKSSGSKRKWSLRQWYQVRRLTAFALSAAMIFGNVGNSAAIAFAGEGYGGNVQFQMDAENIWNAAKDAVSTQSSTGGYFSFGQEDEAEAGRYRKLFAEGNLFEITEGVNFTAVPDVDGMDLRVFVRTPEDSESENYRLTGDEELLFMYLNSGEETVTASVNIDGKVSGAVAVKSYQEAFGQEEMPEDGADAAGQVSDGASDEPTAENQEEEETKGQEGQPSEAESANPETSDGAPAGADEESTAEQGNEEASGEAGEETSAGAEEETTGKEEAPGEIPETPGEAEAGDADETVKEESGNPDEEAPDKADEEESGKAEEEESDKADEEAGKPVEGKPAGDEPDAPVKEEQKEPEEKEPGKADDKEAEKPAEEESGKEPAETAAESKEDPADKETKADAATGKAEDSEPAKDHEADVQKDEAKDAEAKDPAKTDEGGNEGKELSKSENLVRLVERSAAREYGVVAVDEGTTAAAFVMYLSDTGFVPEVEDAGEEVPEAVQAFLDAVAKLPEEITEENAEEASALLYGEVADTLEALMGTEDFEREDVQAAYGKMEAAVKAVDAALGLDAETYAYLEGAGSGYQGSITKTVGEEGIYQRLPRSTNIHQWCGGVLSEYIPNAYEKVSEAFSDETILKDTVFQMGNYKEEYPYIGMPCLEYKYLAAKPGKTRVNLHYEYGFYYKSESGYCDYCGNWVLVGGNQNTYYENVWFDVNVTANYSLKYLPGGNNVTNMPYSPQVKYNVAQDTYTFTTASAPKRDGYTFKGWQYSEDGKIYGAGTQVTLHWKESDGANVNRSLTAVWDDHPTTYIVKREYYVDGEQVATRTGAKIDGNVGDEISGSVLDASNPDWKYYTIDGERQTFQYSGSEPKQLILTEIAENNIITLRYDLRKTFTVIYRDGMGGTIFGDKSHGKLAAGDSTPKFLGSLSSQQYEFMGWAPAINPVVSADDADKDGNIIYTATWKKKSVNYKVEWYDETGKELKTETRNAEVGSKVNVKESDKVYAGYKFDEGNKNNVLSSTVESDGSTVLKLYFIVDPPEPKETEYQVKWYNESGEELKTETRKAEAESKVSVKESDKVYAGYKFDEGNKNNVLSSTVKSDGSTVLKLYFIADPPESEETEYQVKWYDETGKELKTETRKAEVGSKVSVTETDKVYVGYKFDEDNKNNVLTGLVDKTGNTILKLYFIKSEPDPTDPTDPTEPSSPVDPTDPTDPTEPSSPVDPTDPIDPTDPTEPSSPVEPTDPIEPSSPVDPTDPTDPTEPSSPIDPTDPADPTQPSRPTDPTDPTRPVDPGNPTDPTEPTDPTQPGRPTDPTDPAEPTNPSRPTDPANPTNPANPTDPTNPGDPTNPVNPTDPAEPITPTDPVNPTDPVPILPTEPETRPAITPGIIGGGNGGGGGGGGSSSGGGGSSGGRDRDRTPGSVTVTPEAATAGEPNAPEPAVTINPEDVPLAAMPSPDDQNQAPAEMILDEDVPLAALPKTGDHSLPMAGLAGMMLISMLGIFGIMKKRKED